jgi:hypothetical protein
MENNPLNNTSDFPGSSNSPQTPEIVDQAWPENKGRNKFLPILGTIAAMILVVGSALGAYVVSTRVSSRVAVAPTAPASEPFAANCAAANGAACFGNSNQERGHCYVVGPCSVEEYFCGGCVNGWKPATKTCNQWIAECANSCTGGKVSCDGDCVNTSNDENNCGSCGNVCASGKTCVDSSCVSGGSGTINCDTADRDAPASNSITFAKTGTIHVFTSGLAGTITLSGPK